MKKKKMVKRPPNKKLKSKKEEGKDKKVHVKKKKYGYGAEKKIEKVMHEFGKGKLHSGSKKGPKVTNESQAVAIALSEARKKGLKVPKKKKK